MAAFMLKLTFGMTLALSRKFYLPALFKTWSLFQCFAAAEAAQIQPDEDKYILKLV